MNYSITGAFFQEMLSEKYALLERINKLRSFTRTEGFDILSEFEREQILDQLSAMDQYAQTLCTRIGFYS